jgi:hypothetical protein
MTSKFMDIEDEIKPRENRNRHTNKDNNKWQRDSKYIDKKRQKQR